MKRLLIIMLCLVGVGAVMGGRLQITETANAQFIVNPYRYAGGAPGWNYPEAADIVLRYIGNTNASGHAIDEAGGFNGVPYPDSATGPSAVGGYYTFDGSADYYLVDGSGFSAMDGQSNITMSAWVYRLTAGTTYPRIIDRTYNGQFTMYYAEATLTMGGSVKTGDGSYDISNIGTGPVTGAWHHVAVTYDGADLVSYLDGTATGTNSTPSGALVTYTGDITIGDRTDGTTRKWEGRLDEIIVWTNKLSEAQLTDIYSNGPQP